MILNCGGSATIFFRRRRPPLRTLCFSSASTSSSSVINTDQLRTHLDQLHSEAETTRTKGPLLHEKWDASAFHLFCAVWRERKMRFFMRVCRKLKRQRGTRQGSGRGLPQSEAAERRRINPEQIRERDVRALQEAAMQWRQEEGRMVVLWVHIFLASGSNARLRLMRLSEAAEKLQRQALVSVQTGRENDARDLLFQKKKVMQALEKTKSRIELLDELSAQLNKAITMKETQLVGTVAQDVEITREDASTQVRIVSPKEEGAANSNENGDSNANSIKLSEDQEMQVNAEGPSDLPNDNESNNPEVSLISPIWSENDAISCLKGISSFENFLEHLDKQLSKIEAELATVLRFSTLVLDGEEKPKNSKVQHTMEIFEGVCRIRGRYCINQPNVPCLSFVRLKKQRSCLVLNILDMYVLQNRKHHAGQSADQIETHQNAFKVGLIGLMTPSFVPVWISYAPSDENEN
ncbi:hypothetical protein LguiA_022137 [Lonicera macranthoides]